MHLTEAQPCKTPKETCQQGIKHKEKEHIISRIQYFDQDDYDLLSRQPHSSRMLPTENGFMFNGKSQFVTSQNFQYITRISRLSQLFWHFLPVYVTSAVFLSQMWDILFVSNKHEFHKVLEGFLPKMNGRVSQVGDLGVSPGNF